MDSAKRLCEVGSGCKARSGTLEIILGVKNGIKLERIEASGVSPAVKLRLEMV